MLKISREQEGFFWLIDYLVFALIRKLSIPLVGKISYYQYTLDLKNLNFIVQMHFTT